jgi:hypothetical protein
MVDNTNPTNQFHPYQPMDAEPQKGNVNTGLNGMLGKLGINPGNLGGMMKNVDVKSSIESMRGKVNSKNSGMVLGGLAALAIGAGLLRKRSMQGGGNSGSSF